MPSLKEETRKAKEKQRRQTATAIKWKSCHDHCNKIKTQQLTQLAAINR